MEVEAFCCLKAQRGIGVHRVEGVHISVVNVELRRNACCAEQPKVADGFGVKRLAVADKGVGRRQTGEVCEPRGGGIGGEVCAVCTAQI